jgi:hypothetical protein
LGTVPNPRRIPIQISAIILFWLALTGAGKLRIPRWSGALLAAVAAVGYMVAGQYLLGLFMGIGAAGLFAGVILGEIAAHCGTRRDGDIAMAIFVGYVLGQWMPTMF